jgi:hypothetical protein
MSVAVADPAFAPVSWVDGYPIVERGLFINWIGPIYVVITGEGLSQVLFDRFVTDVERAVPALPDGLQTASVMHLNDSSWWTGLSISERSRNLSKLGVVMKSQWPKLKRHRVVAADCLPSASARALMRTYQLFAAEELKSHIVASAEDAYRVVSRKLPNVIAADHLAAHERALLATCPTGAPSLRRRRSW